MDTYGWKLEASKGESKASKEEKLIFCKSSSYGWAFLYVKDDQFSFNFLVFLAVNIVR